MAITTHPAFDALLALYRELDEAIEAAHPNCDQCGTCCNFDTNGMRLYIFSVERMLLRSRLGDDMCLVDGVCSGCQDRLCTIHEIRPLGCRTQFCHETFQDIYESFRLKIMAIEEEYRIPYHYQDAFS